MTILLILLAMSEAAQADDAPSEDTPSEDALTAIPMSEWSVRLNALDRELRSVSATWQAEIASDPGAATPQWHRLRAQEAELEERRAALRAQQRLIDEQRRAGESAQATCQIEQATLASELSGAEQEAQVAWVATDSLLGEGRAAVAARRWWVAWTAPESAVAPTQAAAPDALAVARERAASLADVLDPGATRALRQTFAAVDRAIDVEARLGYKAEVCLALANRSVGDPTSLEADYKAVTDALSAVQARRLAVEPTALRQLERGELDPTQRQLRVLGDALAEMDDLLSQMSEPVNGDDWCTLHVDRAVVGLLSDAVDRDHSLDRAVAAWSGGCEATLWRWSELDTLRLSWSIALREAARRAPAKVWLPLDAGRWTIDGVAVHGAGLEPRAVESGLHRVELKVGPVTMIRTDELQAGAVYAMNRSGSRIALSEPPSASQVESLDDKDWAKDIMEEVEPPDQILWARSDLGSSARMRVAVGTSWGRAQQISLFGPALSISYALMDRDRFDLEIGAAQEVLLGGATYCYAEGRCIPAMLHERVSLGLRWAASSYLRPGLSLYVGGIPLAAPEVGGRLDLDWRQGERMFVSTGLSAGAILWRDWEAHGADSAELDLSASLGLGAYLGRVR